MQLPGWNSIEGTRAWGDFYFWFGIVCLVLLAVSEVLSHRYGLRKDELVAAAEHKTEENRKSEIAALQQEATAAKSKVVELQSQITPRHLSQEQKTRLIDALSQFHGSKLDIICIMGDAESKSYAEDFVAVFRAAGWDLGGPIGLSQALFDTDPQGVEVTLNTDDVNAGKVPAASDLLSQKLQELGIVPGNPRFKNPSVTSGRITLRIGKK